MEGASSLIMLVIVVAVFYFMLIRPENKRKKQAEAMRNSLKKGDVITTIGGIVGKVVTVKPDTIVIETSDDRVRMELTKWAVSTTGVQSSDTQTSKKKEEEKPAEDDAEKAEESAPAIQETEAAEADAEKKD